MNATEFMYRLGYFGVPILLTLIVVSIVRKIIVSRVSARNEKKRAEAIALELATSAPEALREIKRANVLKSDYTPEIRTEKLEIIDEEQE